MKTVATFTAEQVMDALVRQWCRTNGRRKFPYDTASITVIRKCSGWLGPQSFDIAIKVKDDEPELPG